MAAGFGAFGKIVALGDFFRLEVPGAFVTPWDDWLQRTILTVRESLGAAWDNSYLSAPIWRFTLAAGLAGPNPALGVLMPSVDRVGRQFPLTLVTAIDPGLDPVRAHFLGEALFHELEGVALSTLDDLPREGLAAKLAGLTWRDHAPAQMVRSDACLAFRDAGVGGILPDLAATTLARDFRAPSLWSADVAGGPRLMICEGLPVGAQAQGLFELTAPVWHRSRAA